MQTMIIAVVLILSVTSEADELVTRELAFAESARQNGTRVAFLTYLADDSIVFRPFPVAAKTWYQENPDPGTLLIWHPRYAEMASSNDLGFTTGPWEVRKQLKDEPLAYGQFVSVWKRQPDGQLKVVIDAGTTNPRPAQGIETTRVEKKQHSTESLEKIDLFLTEAEVAKEITKDGILKLTSFMATGSMLLRNGFFPIHGVESIRKHLSQANESYTLKTTGTDMSADGRLGYTYGTYESDSAEKSIKGSYLRIWRKEDRWRIAVDLMLPAEE